LNAIQVVEAEDDDDEACWRPLLLRPAILVRPAAVVAAVLVAAAAGVPA